MNPSSAATLPFAHPRRTTWRLVRACGAVMLLIAAVVIVGWTLEVPRLTTFVADWSTMKFSTALCVAAAAGALLLGALERQPQHRHRGVLLRRLALGLALVPLVYGAGVFAEHLTGRELGIDHWFRPQPPAALARFFLRPSPATALALAVAGLALLTWRWPRALGWFSTLAAGVGLLGWMGLIGLIYEVRDPVRTVFFSTLALPTALALLTLSTGLFFLRPAEGVARLFSSPRYAGQLARWLVPTGAALALGLGWARLWAQDYFNFSTALGVAIYGTGMFLTLTFIGLRGAWLVDRLDLRRQRAERERARELAAREAALRRLEASEAQLAANERRFRGIFNSTFNFIGLLTPGGIIIEVNQTALELIGAPPEAVLGRPFAETPWWAHSEAERAKLRAAIARAAAGETARFETTHPGVDGATHYVDFTLKPVRDAAGRVVHLVPEGRDITERKHAEQALAANEELLRQFIQHTPAAIAMLDREMRYVQASDRWVKDYRLEGRELFGRSHYELFPEVPQRWKDIHQRVLAGAVEHCEEDPFPREDGTTEWLQWEARPWRKAGGEIGGLVFYTQVITARKLAEAQMRESEERFRGAFQNSAIGMALVGLDGRWIRVNRALCELVGRTEPELLACTFQDITHPDDLDSDLARVRALLADELDHYQMEKRYFHRDGRVVWVLLAVTLVRDAAGHPVHFVSQIEDVTARREAEQRMKASLEEKEVLLREIHHRVKNNMQVISSLLQLQSGYLRDPADVEIFQECQARIHAMALVHDRLYRSGDLATLDFAAHLRELTALIVRGQSGATGDIRLTVEGEPCAMNLDAAIPLGLIAAELITNAYKHAFRGRADGTIAVRLARSADARVTLTVADDGAGLPADFDPAQARSLGLRLVRALTRQLRAEFSIASRPVGSEISVSFSLSPNAAPP